MATVSVRSQRTASRTRHQPPEPGALRSYRLEKIRQRERFKWLSESVSRRVDRIAVEELEGLLETPATWPGQHEKALVLLALKGTAEAGDALQRFDPGDDARLKSFYRTVLDEYLKASVGRLNQMLEKLDRLDEASDTTSTPR